MTQMQDIFSPLEDTAQKKKKGVHKGDERRVTWRMREGPAESYVMETRAGRSYKEAAMVKDIRQHMEKFFTALLTQKS